MHWSILSRYLVALLFISCAEINGELRPKRDLQLITDLLRAKIDGIKNFSNIITPIEIKKPEMVETHAQIGLQAGVPPNEVAASDPCELQPIQTVTQEVKPLPYSGNYYYKQIRDDGTGLIYKSNKKGEVDVIDTRYTVPEEELKPMPYNTKYLYTQLQNGGDSSGMIGNRGQVSEVRNFPVNTVNNVVQKSSLAYQSGVRPVWTPRRTYNRFETPLRPIQVPAIRNAEFTPDYSYKLLRKDGSVTTWLGTGDVKEQQLRFPPGAIFDIAIPDPPAYLVNRIQNVAANTLCIDKPSTVLCRLNPVQFRYPYAAPNVQVGIFPASLVSYDDAYQHAYDSIATEVKEVPPGYIYVPPTSGYEAPQREQNQAVVEKTSQVAIDDVKVPEKKDEVQVNTVESSPKQGTYMYKQLNADGSAMTINRKDKDGVSVEVIDVAAGVKSGRGDIPE